MKICCDTMKHFAEYRCAEHSDPFDCPDNIIHRDSDSGTYGIIIHDGGRAFVGIRYCPWCGAKLPYEDYDEQKF